MMCPSLFMLEYNMLRYWSIEFVFEPTPTHAMCIIPYLDYIFGMTQEKYMSTYITHVELDNLIHINPIPMSRNKMERSLLEPSRRLHLSKNS